MSDLLSIGASGVKAYQGALATIGENVTNSDTDGYSRRSVVLTEQTSGGTSPYTINRATSNFGGVQSSQVQRVWDQYQAQSAWSSNSDASRSSTRLQYLTSVQTAISDSGSGVSAKLTAIFTTASQLAANPADTATRQTFLSSLSDAAGAISQAGSDLTKIANTVSQQASTAADQVNSALSALAKVNLALKSQPQGTSTRASLEDQRDSLIGTISGAIGVDVTIDSSGAASLKLSDASGPVLVNAGSTTAAQLQITTSSTGQLSMGIISNGTTTAATPTGGTLAGLIDVSNTIAGRRQTIDAIASQLVTSVNSWQAQGLNPAGTAGIPLMTGTSAATIALAANVQPSDVAAASTTGADNGNLLSLTSTTYRGTDGIEAKWQSMTNQQALLVNSATTESSAAATRKNAAYSTLSETSGVDLDTEAAQLLRYQQAYSASAKIIQASRDTLQTILSLFN